MHQEELTPRMEAQIPALGGNWYFITKNMKNLPEYNNKVVELREYAVPYGPRPQFFPK